MTRLETEYLIKIGDSFLILTKIKLGKTPIEVGVGVVRIQTDGLIKIGESTPVLLKISLGNAPVCVGVGVVRLQTDGLIKIGDGPPGIGLGCPWPCPDWRRP